MRVAVLIGGEHLRVLTRRAGFRYDPGYIEKVAYACVISDETLIRILYYDCAPYTGNRKLPVSGLEKIFASSDSWLAKLGEKDVFAIRRGVLKFRGFKPKNLPVANRALTDDDFQPDFEQKGVAMRIGLDMANFSAQRSVERLILVSGDTDCIPAMKHARINGLQIVLISFPNCRMAPELKLHSDFKREIIWPAAS